MGVASAEPRRLRSLHYHVDVQGRDLGKIRLDRIRRPGGSKVRVTYGRGLQLESVEVGEERLMLYDKLPELEEHPEKAYVLPLWRLNGYSLPTALPGAWNTRPSSARLAPSAYDVNAIWQHLLGCAWVNWATTWIRSGGSSLT